MKHAPILIPALAVFILLSARAVTAQPYTEGQYTFRVTALELSQAVDSASQAAFRQWARSMRYGVAFQDQQLAVVVLNGTAREEKTRIVQEVSKKQAFGLMKTDSAVVYDTLSSSVAEIALRYTNWLLIENVAVDSIGASRHEVAGFDCQYVRLLTANGNYRHVYLTDQIKVPYDKQVFTTGYALLDTLALVKAKVELGKSIGYTVAVDTFHPKVQNPEWFSTDIPAAAISNQQFEAQKKQRREKEKEKEKGKGVNLELAEHLKERGLSPFIYEQLVHSNQSVDRYKLLLYSIPGFKGLKRDSIIRIWEQTGILSAKEVVDLCGRIDKLPPFVNDSRFKVLVKAWMLHAMLADHEHRQLLVHNVEQMDCFERTRDMKAKEAAFVKGELPLMDYLLGATPLYELPRQGEWVYFFEALETIGRMIETVLPELKPELTLDMTELERSMHFLIRTANQSYTFSHQEIAGRDHWPTDMTEGMRLNKHFYESVTDKIKQIAADHGIKRRFGVGNFIRCLFNARQIKDYEWLVEMQPDLEIAAQPLYLSVLDSPRSKYLDCKIPMSFPINTQGPASQAEIRNLFGRRTSLPEYLTTAVKQQFVDYVLKEQKAFGLSEVQSRSLSNSVMKKLIADPKVLLNKLKAVKLRASRVEFPSNFTGTFRAQFPDVYQFLQGRFDATHLQPGSSANVLMLMEVNGQTVEVSSVAGKSDPVQSLLHAINPFLIEQQLGIYTFFREGAAPPKFYYFLTDEQRWSLERILEIQLLRV